MARWFQTVNQPGNYWWQKGTHKANPLYLPKQWISLKEATPYTKQVFPGQNFEVHAADNINHETVDGHYLFFNTKSAAMKFIRAYMRSH
jgi:hypothetical protein